MGNKPGILNALKALIEKDKVAETSDIAKEVENLNKQSANAVKAAENMLYSSNKGSNKLDEAYRVEGLAEPSKEQGKARIQESDRTR